MAGLDLEVIRPRKIYQTEEKKYHRISLICESKEQKEQRNQKQTHEDKAGDGQRGGGRCVEGLRKWDKRFKKYKCVADWWSW